MLESYITPMLMGYINRYVKNIKPSDLQVSFWGGDAVLRNLELRLDVLERELRYPLEIKSGHIRELILHIPWNAILSKPVEVVTKDVEIVVKLKDVRNSSSQQASRLGSEDPTPSRDTAKADGSEQQGYLQAYTSRILNNLTFHVQNLVVKVIEEESDMAMSFNIQSLKFYMTDEHWMASYVCTDYCEGDYTLNKVLEITDMVINLQPIESDRVHKQTQKEPFVIKCSFSCHMQSQYRGKKFVKKSTCILFDPLVFSADENQFCLFLHLLDWLLAMYYSGKRLKGRDDGHAKNESSQLTVQQSGPGPSSDSHGPSAVRPRGDTLPEDVLLAGTVGDLERKSQRAEGGDGWGSWVWSFVAEEEGGQDEGEKPRETNELAESSSFAIIAKSITVHLKVTHHGRIPVFSSPRSLSRTVLTVQFSGSGMRIDRVPSTQLFTVSVGVMAIQAAACGLCSCADTVPASWKTSTESYDKVPVFSLGDVNSCDTELALTGSLFDPEITSATPHDTISLPRPELLLAPRPEFTAVWFTYEYYDVGPNHTVEVCEERLIVGEFDLLLSPDTVHRVTHFTAAYRESVKACPLFSEGMVVIGDPKAETSFKITLSRGKATLTSNTHYLPSLSSSPNDHGKSKAPSKQPPLPPSPLPTLCVSLARSSVSIISAMYSGNATPECPQRHQRRVNINQLEVTEIENFTLSDTNDHQSNRILNVPKLEIYQHLKTTGDKDTMPERNSVYLQLHVDEVSCMVSPEQVSKTSFVCLSWYKEKPMPDPHWLIIECPTTPKNSAGGHLSLSIKEVELTKSVATTYTFISAIIASCSVVLVCDSSVGRLCHAIPVLCGPVATEQWNTWTAYNIKEQLEQHRWTGSDGSERLVEFFTAIPDEKHPVESYPTVQLSVGGLAVCLDSTVLDYVAQIPQQFLHHLAPERVEPDPRPTARGGPSGDRASNHSGDTVTTGTHPPGMTSGPSSGENITTTFKSYATKVKVKPVLIVIPSKPLPEDLISPVLPEFPVLPALCDDSSMEALVISLPLLSLASAKSHVLEEPVPKTSSVSTLPWDCTLGQASLMAVYGGMAHYLVEPLTVTVTLADHQGGTGVTVHTDAIALALSCEEGRLLSVCVTHVMDALSPLLLSLPPSEETDDSGIHSSNLPPSPHLPPHHTPSHLSSPAHSTITTATVTTLPAHPSPSSASTSSMYSYHGFSTLWIQAIVTKITLTLFSQLQKNSSKSPSRRHAVSSQSNASSTASYVTPLTSPVVVNRVEGSVARETELVRSSLEIEGVSVQFDVQQKCTDLILKISAVEANLHTQDDTTSPLDMAPCDRGRVGGTWCPYLPSEKILSSKGSALPPELCDIITHSYPAAVQLSQGHSVPTAALRNFVTLELTTPLQSLHKAAKLKLKVQSFEAIVWLPIVDVVSSVFSSLALKRGEHVKVNTASRRIPPEVSSWPAIEANVECCRFVLPSSDYTHCLVGNVGRVTVSPSLNYPTTDVRYVVSASAFRKLAQLSSEKKQPPLPAYQMDLLSVSVWGMSREGGGSDRMLLYAGGSDVRMVYTPALFWLPTGPGISYSTSQRPAILACGHCVELNFTTDLSLMLGPDQVDCLSKILQTNVLSSNATLTNPPDASDKLATPITTPTISKLDIRSSVPYKGLVSGTTVVVTLISTQTNEKDDRERGSDLESSSESSECVFPSLHGGLDSVVVPLVQIQLLNVLCGLCTSTNGGCSYEMSCFNMAVDYCGNKQTMCSYSDLVETGMMSPHPLLETRRGHQQNSREVPPSVVSVVWEIPQRKPPALSVNICRPVKLTLTPQLIQRLSEFGNSMLRSTSSHHGMRTSTDDGHDHMSDTQTELLNTQSLATNSSTHVSSDNLETGTQICTSTAKNVDSSEFIMQVKVRAMQVMVEFQLSSRQLDASEEKEMFSGFEGELVSEEKVVCVADEGMVIVWDHLDLAYPNVTSGSARPVAITGDVHITGLQLLSIRECTTSPIVLPTLLNCFISQHIPSSSLDLSYMTVNLSCGLMDVRLSRETVDLATRILQTLTNLYTSPAGDPVMTGTNSEGSGRSSEPVVHFHDDLRAGDFTYVTESDVAAGYSPQPGEVFFSMGSQDSVMAMIWHYREPRAITKLSILPVPFSFTSEADAPIDIQIGCTLDYWDEDRDMFSVLEEFHLSETTPTEVLVSRVIGCRKWRIAIIEVEWEDEEEEEVERFGNSTEMVDGEGGPVPIASVLSPMLLAGGTCVDSYFSPQLVPVSDLSLTCHGIQLTLIHTVSGHPGQFGGYEVGSLGGSGAQELLRLHIQHLTCHLKQMRSSNTTLQVDGRPSIEFLDFLDLTWRVALHPTHLYVHLERKMNQLSASCSSTGRENWWDVTLKCSPAVVRWSQGLLHTTSLALHTWTNEELGEGGGERERTILNHYILCNDTLQDLHFGQVATDEVTSLRSQQCIGYSWRNHKIVPQTLHLCHVTDGVWRWTKPFSIAAEGSQAVEVYIGRNTAIVNVSVTNIGGLQKQVKFTGNWMFSSTLPFPLHLSLVSSHDTTDTIDASSPTTNDVPTTVGVYKILILPAKSSLASLVLPASCLSGVRVKSPNSNKWSEVYPIHSTTDDWTKPQLLTEMEYCSGQRVNLWYNIKSMHVHTLKHRPMGSRIIFSPLFAICNHLPTALTMVATETNATGPAPISLPECTLSGEGAETILCGFHSDTWYHLSFKQNGCGHMSEPTVSLSTFLLVHLPFSEEEEEDKGGEVERGVEGRWSNKWPYEDDSTRVVSAGRMMTTSIKVSLPLNNGSHCSLHAILERNPVNTITLHLLPDVMVANRCPHSVQLLTRAPDNGDEGGVAREVVSVLNSNHVGLLPESKFFLLAEWKGKTLLSQPLIADPKDNEPSTNVILTERDNDNSCSGVFGNLTLVRRFKGATTIISIIPTYVFHNNTPYDISVATSLFYAEDGLCSSQYSPLVTGNIAARGTSPLLFWEHRTLQGSGGDSETVQALELTAVSEDAVWSVPLSPDFVRHSFALPVSHDQYVHAVLTMHEHGNTVYMVVSEDPAPRLLILNHTQLHVEVVEEGTHGIHSFPQTIPPSQQVAYEPPTYARQYPIVFDREIAQNEAEKLEKSMAQVAVKFQLGRDTVQGDEATNDKEEESVSYKWTEPFSLASDSDRILTVPSGGTILVSTHRRGITLSLTLLPTGEAVSMPLTDNSNSGLLAGGEKKRLEMNLDLRLTQLVVCLEDELTEDYKSIDEILQIIVDGAAVQFSHVGSEGASLELTVDSFHINNMTESGTGDFAVTIVPRQKHHRRASLIETDPAPLARVSVHYSPDSSSLIDNFIVSVQPMTLQIEDGLLNRVKRVLSSYGAPGVLLRISPEPKKKGSPPEMVLVEAKRDVVPLAVNQFVIESTAFYLSARISLRVLLSCNDSPFRFSRYELQKVYSNWTEFSQTVASRYIMSTVAHVGWLVGSLELIGSPGTFIHTVGRGLRDLVTLPYQGLTRSPTWFLFGIGRGTMSFMHHLSSGALRSVTSMASSISHNMERLSLDPHHVSYQTQQRQEHPATHFTTGLISGASSFGLSLMSAVAGIVEQPMQSYHQMEGPVSPTVAASSILKGVGKGLLGAVTKPVGGAMELVSQTGQGLMHGTGLARQLRHKTVELQVFTGSLVRADLQSSCTAFAIKLDEDCRLLLCAPVTHITPTGAKNPATALVTSNRMYLLDSTSNTLQQTYVISDYRLVECGSGIGNLEEVEIEIVANSRQEDETAPKFHEVEYFLEQSCRELKTVLPPQADQLLTPAALASPNLDWNSGSASDLEQFPSAGEKTGVTLLIATHCAVQLVSFYNSLAQLTAHPHTAFSVHRTSFKSDSFISAKSN